MRPRRRRCEGERRIAASCRRTILSTLPDVVGVIYWPYRNEPFCAAGVVELYKVNLTSAQLWNRLGRAGWTVTMMPADGTQYPGRRCQTAATQPVFCRHDRLLRHYFTRGGHSTALSKKGSTHRFSAIWVFSMRMYTRLYEQVRVVADGNTCGLGSDRGAFQHHSGESSDTGMMPRTY